MELKDVYQIIHEFDDSDSTYLEIRMEDVSLKLKKNTKAETAAEIKAVSGKPHKADTADTDDDMKDEQIDAIRSPIVGIFYASDRADGKPFVSAGSKVDKGDTVCMIEAMKMMSRVKADKAVLESHGLFYGKSEVWIESEKLYEVLYEMEV